MKYLGINLTKYVQDVHTVIKTEQHRQPGYDSHIYGQLIF